MMLYQVAAHGSFGVGAGFPRPGAARRRPYKQRRKTVNGNVGADPRVRPGAGAHRGAPLQEILLLLTATWY